MNQVAKSYRQGTRTIPVLHDVSLTVDAGTTVAIMGRSGSGKSTLLSPISGILKPDTGSIHLDGMGYADLSEDRLSDLRASRIGFVFQNFHLVSYLNALENVLLPLRVCGIRERGPTDAAALLARVGLGQRLDHLPAQLSGGEKQRVAIARALIHRPKLILADEPSGSLDEQTSDDIMVLMFSLVAESGAALVLVTHSRAVAQRCSRRYIRADGNAGDCAADVDASTGAEWPSAAACSTTVPASGSAPGRRVVICCRRPKTGCRFWRGRVGCRGGKHAAGVGDAGGLRSRRAGVA